MFSRSAWLRGCGSILSRRTWVRGPFVADICIIYARPSKRIVTILHELLSQRYSVWWDVHIHSGDYRSQIESQLQRAKCVIPVWCRISRSDADVLDEAAYAQRHGIPLLPIRIEDVELPLGFGNLHTVDLIGWDGNADDVGVRQLLQAVERTIGSPAPMLNRAPYVVLNDNKAELPVFFRSVSSHETALRPVAAIQALKLFHSEALLVSAYDIINEPIEHREQIAQDLESCRSAGTLVLLDSGNYEASRKQDNTWSVGQLHEALRITPHDAMFCFDDLNPPSDVEGVLRGVVKSVEREAQQTKKPVLPIVHATRQTNGEIVFDLIPELLRRVCRELRPQLIAIPERELGNGILARARMVYSIRRALDELGFYQPLHLLGTGNPLTIAILSAVGADSFDGLEWCRTVADSEDGRLYHLQQYDFFAWQSEEYASPIVKEAVTSEKIGYSGKVVFHNLEFFATWMRQLRDHIRSGKIERFLTDRIPGGADSMELLGRAVPEIFG
jgi:queuine/archaeosine tRNA-ribosyltransferase